MTVSVALFNHTYRGVTIGVRLCPMSGASSNRSRRLSNSLKSRPRVYSSNRRQLRHLFPKEAASDAIKPFSSTTHAFLGFITAVVAGSIFIIKEKRDVFEDQIFYSSQSTSSTPYRILSQQPPLLFTKSTTFAEGAEKNTYDFPETYDISVRALKGSRLSMEDEYSINNGGRFVAIFDGHGGGEVSAFLRDKLYAKIAIHLAACNDSTKKSVHDEIDVTKEPSSASLPPHISISDMVKSTRAAFVEVDNEVLQKDDFEDQGSTALVVWLHEDLLSGKRTLVSANLGDSRAVMSRDGEAIDITRDHKPDVESEKKRILSIGENIEWDEYSEVYRIRNLSLSRAIGDRFARPAISGEVEIKLLPLLESGRDHTKANDEFIVLASDGLWDVMTSQECVEFVHERLKDVSKTMIKTTALERQRLKYTRRRNMSSFVAKEAIQRGSGDNVCVIIVWLTE